MLPIELMTENAELKQTIAALKKKIVTLQQETVNLKNPPLEQTTKLSGEAEKILMFFTKHTDYTAHQVSQSLSLDLTRTEHWLNVLENDTMVYAAISMYEDTTYSIGSEGRKYLVANNMV